jgi:hypothetical protein
LSERITDLSFDLFPATIVMLDPRWQISAILLDDILYRVINAKFIEGRRTDQYMITWDVAFVGTYFDRKEDSKRIIVDVGL